MEKHIIVSNLTKQIQAGNHIIGIVAGSGMTAKYTSMGGADLILTLSAGKFRQMGRSSFTSYLCYSNSNQLVMELGTKEILPLIPDKPVIFGISASDPTIGLYDYILSIKRNGFGGIVNFPTMCILDGAFREALEEDGNCYANEIEAVRIANYLDLFTVAFVNDEIQAEHMINAGADLICVHFGMTKGGHLGAKRFLSLEIAINISQKIFEVCDAIRPGIIKMVYGGPATSPLEMKYIYQKTQCNGYIGGSTFDRLPIEDVMINTTKAFKTTIHEVGAAYTTDVLKNKNYMNFVKEYVGNSYQNPNIKLTDIARIAFLSSSYLSTKFKAEAGISFTEYLVNYRVEKAKELMAGSEYAMKTIAEMVGYVDYVQFSKIFKKYTGQSPSEYKKKYLMKPQNKT